MSSKGLRKDLILTNYNDNLAAKNDRYKGESVRLGIDLGDALYSVGWLHAEDGQCLFISKRVGSDIRIVCCGCGRDMTMERVKLEKAIKNIIPTEESHAT